MICCTRNTSRFKTSFVAVVGGLTMFAALPGCTGNSNTRPMGEVEGVVTWNGAPLEGAEVVFQPSDYRPSVGVTDKAGHYALRFTHREQGAVVGDHMVRITGKMDAHGGEGGQPAFRGRAEFLPEKYHEKTTLTAQVKKGKNEINFDLQGDGTTPRRATQ